MLVEPPYASHRYWPIVSASDCDCKEYEPEAPPSERTTLIPAAWHVAMDEITLSQFWPSPEVLMKQDWPMVPDGMLLPLPYSYKKARTITSMPEVEVQ